MLAGLRNILWEYGSGPHGKTGVEFGARRVLLCIIERSGCLYVDHRIGSGLHEAAHHRELRFIPAWQEKELQLHLVRVLYLF